MYFAAFKRGFCRRILKMFSQHDNAEWFSYLSVSLSRFQFHIWCLLGNAMACCKQSIDILWKVNCNGEGCRALCESKNRWKLNWVKKSDKLKRKSVPWNVENYPPSSFRVVQVFTKGPTKKSGLEQVKYFRWKRVLNTFKYLFRSELPDRLPWSDL